jgi:threonine dehydratase
VHVAQHGELSHAQIDGKSIAGAAFRSIQEEERVLSQDLATRVLGATLEDFRGVADKLRAKAPPTPLITAPQPRRNVRLKTENLQAGGSFKIRAAYTLIDRLCASAAKPAIATASAGNFGLALALAGRDQGVVVTVHAPDTAAQTKIEKLRALGATVIVHCFEDWWRIISTRETGLDDGRFVHPVAEPEVILANGVVALEILDAWPEVETILAPFGGGGLTCGLALACRAAGRSVRILACEVEGAAPLFAARLAGAPTTCDVHRSFVDGIGSYRVLDAMWPLASTLIDDSVVVPVEQVRNAVRELALDAKLVVEGAGATPYAALDLAALSDQRVAVVISGGNLDADVFSGILGRNA